MSKTEKGLKVGFEALGIVTALMASGAPATSIKVATGIGKILLTTIPLNKGVEDKIGAAVRKALENTLQAGLTDTQRKIVQELIGSLDTPLEFDQRVKQSDAFLSQSATPADRAKIKEVFTTFFRMEISKNRDLAQFIALFEEIIPKLNQFDTRLDNFEYRLDGFLQEISALAKSPMLVLPGFSPAVELIGRENALVDFADELEGQEKAYVITGIGGVGKTEFVKAFLEQNRSEFHRIGWFEYNKSFKDTLLDAQGLVLNSSAPLDNPELRYSEILGLLGQLTEYDILVFDNVDNHRTKEDMDKILALPCRIIITSRDNFEENRRRVRIVPMDLLTPDACGDLFLHYLGKAPLPEENEYLQKIIILAGQHTLALELLAKTCRVTGISLPELHDKLIGTGFSLEGITDKVFREGDPERKRFIEHMTKLYDISKVKDLGSEAERLLCNLCILPLTEFPKAVLKEWLALKDYNLLYELDARGWLKVNENDTIDMHNVISEVLCHSLKPDCKQCEKTIRVVLIAVDYDAYDVNVYEAPYLHCAESIEARIKDKDLLLADLCHNIGWIYSHRADYSHAILYYEKALSLREEVFGKKHPDTAITYNNIARVYHRLGDYPKALEWYEKDLVISEEVLGKKHPDTATTYNNIAGVYSSLGDYPKALEWFEKALGIHEEVLGKKHPDTATTYNNIAGIYYCLGDYPKSLEWYEKAFGIHEEVLGKKHPDTATTYNNIALMYHSLSDYLKALEWYERTLVIHEEVLGKKHPDTANTYNNIAGVYSSLGDYPTALEWLDKALVISEEVLGKKHPLTATTYHNTAGIYGSLGNYSKALEWFEKALVIHEDVLGKKHPSTATTYHSIALVYDSQGDYPKAFEWYEKALGIREEVLGKKHPDTATTYHNIALMYHSLGDYPKALEWFETALVIYEEVLGKKHPSTATTYNNIARVYDSQGDYPKALEWYQRAWSVLNTSLGPSHPNTKTVQENLESLKSKMC